MGSVDLCLAPVSTDLPRLPAATDSDPDVSVNAARCVLRIKVSVVGIRNKGLRSTTCKLSTPFPPGQGCFHLIFSLKKPGETLLDEKSTGPKTFAGGRQRGERAVNKSEYITNKIDFLSRSATLSNTNSQIGLS